MLTWLKGIIPPLTTPFDEAGKVQAGTLEAEIDYQIACGVEGVCVTGSTGEAAGLTIVARALQEAGIATVQPV